ncbi:hypothetical protein RMN56_17780 [Micromonospora halotolerans]|uniref:Uncharacterized protein n=1 Tax=Micromonospora halotolerans TaxID=709879 RepID=A0ABY9ZQA4_9ACTN|nr:hypothetical protein [Micromonospora halotolerans]WNM37042.1 hypothetical protein RMN56_17780 [Micromonospora halotolerans]
MLNGHHRWCNRAGCTPLAHTGRIVTVNSLDGYPPVTFQLLQGHDPRALPLIVLKGGQGSVLLTVQQARAVAHVLRSQVRQA